MTGQVKLMYTLMCDDVRVEMGNKISLMGVFQNILVERMPFSIIKFAILNHWRGEGTFETEVRILSPDRSQAIVNSQPSPIELTEGGFTDNVSFFVNVVIPASGTYWVQTMANGMVYEEFPLYIADAVSEGMLASDDEMVTDTIH